MRQKDQQKTDVVDHPQVFRHIGFMILRTTLLTASCSGFGYPKGSIAWVVKL
jgi:hypothetical protein